MFFVSDQKTKPSWAFYFPNTPWIKKCKLLAFVVLGYFHNLYLEDKDLASWRMLTAINSSKKLFQDEATNFLVTQMQPFFHVCPPDSELQNNVGELHNCLDNSRISFCDFSGQYIFEGQFHIFHKDTGKYLVSFPSDYKPEKRQFFFLGSHLPHYTIDALIVNITSFFATFGSFCGFCKKQFSGKGTQHKCLLTKTCFSCRRPLRTQYYYTNRKILNLFCDSSIFPSIAKKCQKCHLLLSTPHCEINHKQKVCRWGYYCDICRIYTYHSKFMGGVNLREKHECGMKPCYFCGEYDTEAKAKKAHQCRIQLPKRDTSFNNVAILDVQISESTKSYCKTCFVTNETCEFCSDILETKVLLCTVLLEDAEKHGNFSRYTFFPDKIILIKNDIIYDYINPRLRVERASKKEKHTEKFGTYRKRRVLPSIFSENSILEFFFSFIVHKEIMNYTFVINDYNHNILPLIVATLFKNGIMADVIGSPTIICINVRSLNIRFVNFENYSDLTFSEQVIQSKLKPVFFPMKWRKEKFFQYSAQPPNISDFFCFHDTAATINEKQKFVNMLEEPWNFFDQFEQFSYFCAKVTFTNCLNFLKSSFLCQKQLQDIIQENSNIVSFVHPFNPPLCTRAGYAYKLMCLFSEKMQNLRIVLPPISMQSSIGELEWCSYTVWEQKAKTSFYAWSPEGQKRYKEAVPDLQIGNEVYFWNGCMVHGHRPEVCLFKRKKPCAVSPPKKAKNCFGEELDTAFANYEKKKKMLVKNHPELNVTEMWDCEWRKEKKTNIKVQYFMDKIYRNPPTYRLNPSIAGEKQKIARSRKRCL